VEPLSTKTNTLSFTSNCDWRSAGDRSSRPGDPVRTMSPFLSLSLVGLSSDASRRTEPKGPPGKSAVSLFRLIFRRLNPESLLDPTQKDWVSLEGRSDKACVHGISLPRVLDLWASVANTPYGVQLRETNTRRNLNAWSMVVSAETSRPKRSAISPSIARLQTAFLTAATGLVGQARTGGNCFGLPEIAHTGSERPNCS